MRRPTHDEYQRASIHDSEEPDQQPDPRFGRAPDATICLIWFFAGCAATSAVWAVALCWGG